jgi:hypothetical protein
MEYTSAGITFTSGALFQGNFFPGTEATNHFISSSQTIATFTLPVYEISLTSLLMLMAILTSRTCSRYFGFCSETSRSPVTVIVMAMAGWISVMCWRSYGRASKGVGHGVGP